MSDTSGVSYAKKAQSLPASTQFAITTVLPNIANGAFWGFTTVNDAREHAEVLKKDSNIVLRRVKKDVIIEVSPRYLMSAVSAVDPNLITQKDINRMNDFSAKAVVDFEKFLVLKGKTGFAGLIGVYCTNDTTSISYKSVSYPAFRLPLSKVLQVCNTFKYMIKVNGTWMLPQKAMEAGQALYDSMTISPTKTGVFIEIKAVGTLDDYKKFEAMYKFGRKK